jgi:hypothetical protein
MGNLSQVLLAVMALGSSLAAGAPTADPPAAPAIVSVTYSGNGCPQGSRNEMYGDEDTLNFAFHDFDARFGADGRSTNCQVHLNLVGGGPGWALSLETVNVKGALSESADAEVSFYTTSFWSQTASDTITKTRRVSDNGSAARAINVRQQLGSASPCGSLGILNINFRAALTSGSSASFTGSGGAPITEELSFAWRRC